MMENSLMAGEPDGSRYSGPYSPSGRLKKLTNRLYWLFRSRIIIEHQPADTHPVQPPIIFAFNHNNSREVFFAALIAIMSCGGNPVSFPIDWMYRYLPVAGWLFRLTDPVYVHNKPPRYNWMRYLKKQNQGNVYRICADRIRKGGNIGIFPEGTRNPDPKFLKRGRRGVGRIALETGAPVLPIGIDFPQRLQENRIPRGGPYIFRMGTPIYPRKILTDLGAANLNVSDEKGMGKKAIQHFSSVITHQVMVSLSTLCGKKYPFTGPGERHFKNIKREEKWQKSKLSK